MTQSRVIGDRYLLTAPVGRGGMGTVWRARDQLLNREIALKEIEMPLALPESERESMRARVLREARTAAQMSHPAAVTVFDVLEEEGKTFIAMEFVDAPSLADLVAQTGPLTPDEAARIGAQVLEALEAAHAKGFVHRDVKPENVMVTADGRIKLADFGIAAVKGDPRLTTTGVILGSPSYMSPEQARGEAAGPEGDLWSLGATLYFAVEGRAPFDKGQPIATLMAVVNEEPRPAERAGALLPLIRALLTKDPKKRPSAWEVRQQLEDAVALTPAAAEPEADVEAAPVPTPAPQDAPRGPKAATPVDIWEGPEEPVTEAPSRPSAVATTPKGQLGEDAAPAAAPPTEPRGAGPASRRARDLRTPLILVGLAAIALLALFMGTRMGEDDGAPEQAARRPSPRQPRVKAAQPRREEAAPPAQSTSQEEDATTTGWTPYAIADTGYRIAYPSGWNVVENPVDDDSTRFEDGAGRYLLLDWTDAPSEDAVAAWELQEQSFARRHQNYRRIQLVETTFQDFDTAAIWEFTYSDGGATLHALDLGFADEQWGFALYFQTRDRDWASSQDIFDAFKRNFGRAE